ncbi:MAG TPA: CusA/CzcA family heavy metal efflux RND transporter [Candidatus Kapabacteria bacterium]|nr:CusA/CzcA family heavy metal efflux RND transporter [Candidatus Kapabacteria bacterium]
MIRKLITFALTQRLATFAISMVILGIGVWALTQLKIEAYPDVADTEVVVVTKFDGRAAEEVEQQVTVPLERALNNVPRVSDRRSKTIFGLSVIHITFDEGTDDYFARQQVLEKLRDADLPDGVTPELAPLSTPVGEIFRYVIEGDAHYSAMDLRTLQDWEVVPRLLQVPGVADVVNFGGLVKQFHILTTPERLEHYNLTLQNVVDAVQANNLNTGGSVVTRGGQALAVRGMGAIRSREDIENIVVAAKDGVPVFIRDIASVEINPLPPSGVLGYSIPDANVDQNAGVQGLVLMRRGQNPSDVLSGIREKIDEINASVLPPGVHLRTMYDRGTLVGYTLETVLHTLFEGISIVIIVLIFFLGSPRSALVVAITIPVSLLFAFILMKLTGIPANLLSLGAIDFGIIVDGAVVMAENVMRQLRDATPEERAQGVLRNTMKAAQEVGREIFFAVAIIILAYLPMFTLQRVEGKLFSPMAYTLSFAIFGSMLIALTLIPVILATVYRRVWAGEKPKKIEWHNPVFDWMRSGYDRVLAAIMRRPALTASIAGLVVVAATIAGGGIGTEFLPELDEGSFNIRCFLPAGISLDEAAKIPPIIRGVIAGHPQVEAVVSQLGRNDDGTDPYGPNRIETYVGLKDYAAWASDTSKRQLLFTIKQQLEQKVPGASFSFSQPILDNVTEAVTGSVADLAILISGRDLDLMRREADTVLKIVRSIPGASEYGIEQEGNQAQLSIQVDRAAAARYGVNVSDVQRMVEGAIGGKTVGQLYDGERRFDIVVRYVPESRGSLDAIRNMLVTAPNGARIPMSSLAGVKEVDGATIIQRMNGDRQISVRTNIRGRDQGSFVAEAQKRVAGAIHLPKGYSMDWGGQFENLTRARNRLLMVVPITIVLIFVVLFALYRKPLYAGLTLMNVPFALVGGIAGLMIRGYNFNVSAGVGFVSLFGVAVMSGVLLVSRINQLRDEGGMELAQAVRAGASMQFRPILMMMVVALLGLIPAARASGIGSDVQRPLATVIVGGLCSSLILTLLALPAIYYLIERRRERRAAAREVAALRPAAQQAAPLHAGAGGSSSAGIQPEQEAGEAERPIGDAIRQTHAETDDVVHGGTDVKEPPEEETSVPQRNGLPHD